MAKRDRLGRRIALKKEPVSASIRLLSKKQGKKKTVPVAYTSYYEYIASKKWKRLRALDDMITGISLWTKVSMPVPLPIGSEIELQVPSDWPDLIVGTISSYWLRGDVIECFLDGSWYFFDQETVNELVATGRYVREYPEELRRGSGKLRI